MKPPGKEKEKEKKKDAIMSSFATTEQSSDNKEDEEHAYHCFEKTTCLLPKCPDKKTNPKSECHKPQYFK